MTRRPFIVESHGILRDDLGRIIRNSQGYPELGAWRYVGNIDRGEAEAYRLAKYGSKPFPYEQERRFAAFEKKREALAFIQTSNRTFGERLADEYVAAKAAGASHAQMRERMQDYIAYKLDEVRKHFSKRHVTFNRIGEWNRGIVRGSISRIKTVRRALAWLDRLETSQ